jgi:hypothetical protein
MQSLYYLPISQSLELHDAGSDSTLLQTWSGIDNLIVSASAYNTTGSEFNTTLGSLRILAYSGSTLAASFPVETTNLYYPPFPTNLSPNIPVAPQDETQYTSIIWDFNIPNTFSLSQLSGSRCSIYEITSSLYYVSQSFYSNGGLIPAIVGNSYLCSLFGSGSYSASLFINDATSGSIVFSGSSINTPISTSFTPLSFHDYEVTFSLVNPAALNATINWAQYEYFPSPWIDNDLYIDYVLLAGGYTGTSGSLSFVSGSSIYVNQNCQTTSGQTGSFTLTVRNETDAATLYNNTLNSVVTSYTNLQSFTFNASSSKIYSVTASSNIYAAP